MARTAVFHTANESSILSGVIIVIFMTLIEYFEETPLSHDVNLIWHVVISKEKKFLYMKPGKTGGTSIWRGVMKNKLNDAINKKDEGFEDLIVSLKDETFDDYFKFAFVRNPYERLVSAFHHVTRTLKKKHFKEFVLTKLVDENGLVFDHHAAPQHLYCFRDGVKYVDFIGRFENLQKDWGKIAGRFGLEPGLPHLKKSSGHAKNYRSYYDPELIEYVGKVYAKDLELLGYRF